MAEKSKPGIDEKLAKQRTQKLNYRELYRQALNRDLMLIERMAQLEKELERFTNMAPIGKQ